jgi:DNA-binding XRE family transcriptional regulator
MTAPSSKFKPLLQSGMTHNEFASLIGVSRGSVNNWIKGHTAPTKKLQVRVRRCLVLVAVAVERGYLPKDLPKVYKGNMSARRKYIRDSLKRVSGELKAEQAST